jgi:hypothetical protein
MSEIIIERFKLLEIDIKIAANNPINLPNSSIKPFLKPLKPQKRINMTARLSSNQSI